MIVYWSKQESKKSKSIQIKSPFLRESPFCFWIQNWFLIDPNSINKQSIKIKMLIINLIQSFIHFILNSLFFLCWKNFVTKKSFKFSIKQIQMVWGEIMGDWGGEEWIASRLDESFTEVFLTNFVRDQFLSEGREMGKNLKFV